MTTKVDASSNFDADRMKEEIATGDEKMPQIDVEADYERSKELQTSDLDRTQAGAQAAMEVTAPEHELMNAEDEDILPDPVESQGDPDAFRSMAKEANPRLRNSQNS